MSACGRFFFYVGGKRRQYLSASVNTVIQFYDFYDRVTVPWAVVLSLLDFNKAIRVLDFCRRRIVEADTE